MEILRPSRREDEPRLRELWLLAFGDGGDYLDNFFHNYYQPRRVLVLETEGAIQAMTAWFPSSLRPADGEPLHRCAYLYAVATHPDLRGRGLAGKLLGYCDDFLRQEGFQALTTVPARPDLHIFFGGHGFEECFCQQEQSLTPAQLPAPTKGRLCPVSPEEYRDLRETLLAGTDHIDLDLDGIVYQAGACALSGGGLYRLEDRSALLCLEGGEDDRFVVKELLGPEPACACALALVPTVCSGRELLIRRPGGDWQFGMLKWLYPQAATTWNWTRRAYLGLAFD